jgi:hypothetical protein
MYKKQVFQNSKDSVLRTLLANRYGNVVIYFFVSQIKKMKVNIDETCSTNFPLACGFFLRGSLNRIEDD